MSVVVVGCGRSGTNMVVEILAASPSLWPTASPEDKQFFERGDVHDQGLLTKCDTVYFTVDQFNQTLNRNPHLKVIWTIRDPRDMILSKLRRGQSRENGGDNERLAEDGTPAGCLADIGDMAAKYQYACSAAPERLLLVKMEEVILDIEQQVNRLCDWLHIDQDEAMFSFFSRMRNPDKRRRYSGIDRSEVAKWRHWERCYDGFRRTSR